MDTDLVRGLNVPKSNPTEVARQTLDALVAGKDEILADAATRTLKQGLSREQAPYLGLAGVN
jgi:hypothetical protein